METKLTLRSWSVGLDSTSPVTKVFMWIVLIFWRSFLSSAAKSKAFCFSLVEVDDEFSLFWSLMLARERFFSSAKMLRDDSIFATSS